MAFDDRDHKIKHYRVDKMMDISVEDSLREGKEINFRIVDDETSMLIVDVAVSYQFFGWIFSLGKNVKVTGPEEVVKQMKKAAEEFKENY